MSPSLQLAAVSTYAALLFVVAVVFTSCFSIIAVFYWCAQSLQVLRTVAAADDDDDDDAAAAAAHSDEHAVRQPQ